MDAGKVESPPYATLGGPNPQEMKESSHNSKQWTYSSVQVGEFAISTDKINHMWASCCCGCVSTLKIEYLDLETKKSWVRKFRFWCDDAGALNALTKINAHLGGKSL